MVKLRQACFVGIIVIAVLGGFFWLAPQPIAVRAAPGQEGVTQISSYWNWKIQRWDSLIIQESERRQLDPDLLASLVWMESRGISDAVGPVGAVGLMQIMPKESGFSWRPAQEELLDPEINLFWGTRTLATVIHQGQGDIFHALAAYNGGWDRVANRGPTRFATTVLLDYVQAVAVRYHLEAGTWVAFFAVDEGKGSLADSDASNLRGPIWIADAAQETVYFSSHGNDLPNGTQLIPDIPPAAIVAQCTDEAEVTSYAVGVWLYRLDSRTWVNGDDVAEPVPPVLSDPPDTSLAAVVTPPAIVSPVPTTHPAIGAGFVAGSSGALTMTTAGAFSDADAVPASSSTGDVNHDDPAIALYSQQVALGLRAVVSMAFPAGSRPLPTPTPEPTSSTSASSTVLAGDMITATPTPTTTVVVPCPGGELRVNAWPMDSVHKGTYWEAQVFAEGMGGDCDYTYAWNDESDIRGEHMRGPIVFTVSSTEFGGSIVGTVVVTSGDETARMGVYINPP